MHSFPAAHCARQRVRSRIFRAPFSGRIPFLASPFRSGLANASGRIEFNIVLFMDWSFASGCSPPRLSTTQLPSATDRPVLLSDGDFHPTVDAYSQAHSSNRFAVNPTDTQAVICSALRASITSTTGSAFAKTSRGIGLVGPSADTLFRANLSKGNALPLLNHSPCFNMGS